MMDFCIFFIVQPSCLMVRIVIAVTAVIASDAEIENGIHLCGNTDFNGQTLVFGDTDVLQTSGVGVLERRVVDDSGVPAVLYLREQQLTCHRHR